MKYKKQVIDLLFMAAELGFEPRQTESESVVLTVTLFGNVFNADYLITFHFICQGESFEFFKAFYFFWKNRGTLLKSFSFYDKMKKTVKGY